MGWLQHAFTRLLSVVTLAAIGTQAQAQIVVVRSDSAHTRLSPIDSTGLLPTTRINHMLFTGIHLSKAQADSIDRLRTKYLARRQTALSKLEPGVMWDSATKVRMQPLIEQQFAAYRAVLTPAQRVHFDANSTALLAAWRQAIPLRIPLPVPPRLAPSSGGL